MGSNITKVKKALLALADYVDSGANGLVGDAMVSALNTARGLMKRRIFNLGLDAEGNLLGKYHSRAYARVRISIGRQIAKKDLELYGGLKSSIETVKQDDKHVIIAFNNDLNTVKARGQEEQIAKLRGGTDPAPIFLLSEEEFEHMKVEFRRLIKQIITIA